MSALPCRISVFRQLARAFSSGSRRRPARRGGSIGLGVMVEKLSIAAIDLGASSGRVALAGWDGARLDVREVRRFDTPRRTDPATGYQCWDVDEMEQQIRGGLAAAAALAPLGSIGVDGWGVDYALLDADGERVGPAVCYRDDRTRGVMERVLLRLPREEVYRRSGIQFLPFNTLYQLAATAELQPAWLERARHLLLLPDYFHARLGGAKVSEYTNATTTQLYGVTTDDWDSALLALCGLSRASCADVVAPGTRLGEATLPGARATITAPATHDTASAVAALPLRAGDAFLISGTWSLMGVERERPVLSEAALRYNVTNEGGAERRYRVLKNIAGLWLTQRLSHELGVSEPELCAAAARAPAWQATIDADDARFLNPPSMAAAIQGFCRETGQAVPADAGALARCALESLALSYRRVMHVLERLCARRLERIVVGGGGSNNALLNQLTADACEVPLLLGPSECSLLGNACVQLMGLGAFASLADARTALLRSFDSCAIEPRGTVPDEAVERFERLSRHPSSSQPSNAAEAARAG